MLKLLDIKYLDIYNCLLYPFKVKTKMCFLKFCPQGDILSLEEPLIGVIMKQQKVNTFLFFLSLDLERTVPVNY